MCYFRLYLVVGLDHGFELKISIAIDLVELQLKRTKIIVNGFSEYVIRIYLIHQF